MPMTDEELDFVEEAHEKSTFLEIYRDPMNRFVEPFQYVFYPATVTMDYTLPARMRAFLRKGGRRAGEYVRKILESASLVKIEIGRGCCDCL